MEYIGYEVKLNLFKRYSFWRYDVIEKDFVIYFGMLSVCFTMIYNKL
jgi:hypothetical protein